MDYKAEADKIVKMFRQFTEDDFDAIECAIKHVEGIMEETDSLVTMDKYTKILNQLKQM